MESMSSQGGEVPERARACECMQVHMCPGGTWSRPGGSALLPTPPTQTPLTTHRHGNQGAQEGDAGWAEGV